uniref:Integrase, catalytic region, zinc finger, CCHC-type, peptidase aspartic, catalytic n=1 Tax=Tanacetum cinerariifolium TaxID=118510 RepID=A0A699H3X7_TANCI|nr:hypothetical protein [Tanacetum cinerariifolium]
MLVSIQKEFRRLLILIRQTCPSINSSSGQTLTVVENACPLTRIVTTAEVSFKKPSALESDSPKPEVTLVYSRKPKKSKSTDPVSKSKHMIEDRSQLTNFVTKFLGTVKFKNDHVEKIMGYGDYQIRNVTILKIEAVATACYTQNRSIIRLRHRKTPYELLHNKPPKLSFLHVFRALCYPTYVSENLGKLQTKADIGIFIGYAPQRKHFEFTTDVPDESLKKIHVDFDELIAMAFEHNSLEPALHEMTPATISSGLVPNPPPSTSFVPPSRTDLDLLFQPLFYELLTPPPSVDFPALKVIAPIAKVVALEPAPIISNDVEEDNHDLHISYMNNDPIVGVEESPKTPTFHNVPLHESLHEESTSQGSSSNMRQTHTSFKSLGR